MLPKSNIAGRAIAWGRAKWMKDGAEEGYVFYDQDGFQYKNTPQWLAQHGITDEVIFDCVDQIEAKLGSPENHRAAMGLFPNSGYSNVGITVKSSLNDKVICVFTPTSMESGEVDAYFEWYYDADIMDMPDLPSFIKSFDTMTGARNTNILTSPVVPSYMEACEIGHKILESSAREQFLVNVWNFHKTPSKGFKVKLEQEILGTLSKIQRG